jgi:hypothetical protein
MKRLISPAPFRFLLALGVVVGLDFGCSNSPNSPSTPPLPISVVVTPARANVAPNSTQKFLAGVAPYGANPSVVWSVAGTWCSGATCGTIDATGKYTAPATVATPADVVVTASSVVDPTKSAAATVSILPVESYSMIPDSVGFGNQMVNTTSAPKLVTVTNTGSTPELIPLELSGDNGQWKDFAFTDDCPSMLAVGASCTINITFTPSVTGVRVANIAIIGPYDYSSVFFVTLVGMGTS